MPEQNRTMFGDVIVEQPTAFGDKPQSSSLSENTANTLGGAFGIGANRGISNVLGAPVDLAAAGLRVVGVPATDPIGGSQSIARGLRTLGFRSTPEGFEELAGRPPTQAERITGRVGEEVGANAIAVAPVLGIARGAAAAPAATTLGRIGQTIVAPARTAPAATAATDVAISAASGTGAGVAGEIAPGSTSAELTGQFAPVLVPSLLAGVLRGVVRGGPAGQASLQSSIDDFAAAGSTPSVGQGTGNIVAQGAESTLGRLPGGAGQLLRTSQRQAQEIGDTVDQIASGLARNADPEQAGRLIVRGLTGEGDSFIGRFQDTSEKLFNNLDSFVPPTTSVIPTNSQAAFSRLSSPVAGAENLSDVLLINPTIRRAADAFAADVGQSGIEYGTLKGVRSAVGRMLSSPSLIDDAPRAELKQIYAALTADMQATAAAAGPEAARAFERANRYYSAGLTRIEDVIQPLVRNRVPERVFTALERSGRDGATTLRTIYRSLSPLERSTTTGLVLRRLGHATPGQQGAEGLEFSTQTFLTNWNRLADDSKSVLFGQPQFTGLRRDLDAIARASARIREGSQVLANPSGTSAAGAQAAGAGLLGVGTLQAAQGQFGLLGSVLAGMAASKGGAHLMTSPAFVRWLARGTTMDASSLPVHIGRLTTTLQGADAATAQEAVELLRVLSEDPASIGSR